MFISISDLFALLFVLVLYDNSYNFLDKMVGITSLFEISVDSYVGKSSQMVETHHPLHVPGVEGLLIPGRTRGRVLKVIDDNTSLIRWEVNDLNSICSKHFVIQCCCLCLFISFVTLGTSSVFPSFDLVFIFHSKCSNCQSWLRGFEPICYEVTEFIYFFISYADFDVILHCCIFWKIVLFHVFQFSYFQPFCLVTTGTCLLLRLAGLFLLLYLLSGH